MCAAIGKMRWKAIGHSVWLVRRTEELLWSNWDLGVRDAPSTLQVEGQGSGRGCCFHTDEGKCPRSGDYFCWRNEGVRGLLCNSHQILALGLFQKLGDQSYWDFRIPEHKDTEHINLHGLLKAKF